MTAPNALVLDAEERVLRQRLALVLTGGCERCFTAPATRRLTVEDQGGSDLTYHPHLCSDCAIDEAQQGDGWQVTDVQPLTVGA